MTWKNSLLALAIAAGAFAQSQVSGQLTVSGQTVKLTQAYAYRTKGFFDAQKQDTVLLLTDRPLTDAQVHDRFGLAHLAEDGKLFFVQEIIDASGKIINFEVGHRAFKAPNSGFSTEHVFEGKLQGSTISGKTYTRGPQDWFGTKYEYTATFQATVAPK
jgi:hypothetical protein